MIVYDFETISVFLVFVCIVAFYRYVVRNNNAFKGKPFPSLKPEFFFGNTFGMNFGTEAINDFDRHLYAEYPNAK
jgi:hypothetical protein